MKALYKFLMSAVMAGSLASCSTDIETPKIQGFDNLEPKELTASSNEVIMEGVNENSEAVTFTWGDYQLSIDNPAYHVPDKSITNYLEMSPTSDFSLMESLAVEGNTKTFTEKELNPILIRLGYEPWQKTPLHVRVRYAVADNVEYQYGMSLEIKVAAYGLRLNRMDVLATDKATVLAALYSPLENGVYTGYVAASAWMNFYLQERDNTIWGSQPGSAFTMSKDMVTAYNLWFPGTAGSYRVTADTKKVEWTAEYLSAMTLTSASGTDMEMTFKQSTNSWSCKVVTTKAETFSAKAVTQMYNIENEGGATGTLIDFGSLLSIPEAGNWVVTIEMSGENPTAKYEVDEEPVVTYEPYLEIISPDDWNEVKCRMFSFNNDGTYMGFYYAGEWENYKFATVGRETIYGSVPNSLRELDSSNESWNLYVESGAEGLYLYYANLPENYWNAEAITKLVVRGDHDLESTMIYDKNTKVWTADLDIQEVGWGMQILINDDWSNHFKSKGDGILGYLEGDNIMPPGSGRYRLTVSLYDMGNLTYTFTVL
mgnify:CR=1 FL=1|jgi:hypothetical protein